jgi:uncharacterized protein (TIGR02996 family)
MSHPENRKLLSAVIANAEEDAPRLAYANWLERHGDPDRATFISSKSFRPCFAGILPRRCPRP